MSDAFERYVECGILLHGCARAQCDNPECNHTELIAFSCKTRGLCPSCDAKRAVIFAEHITEHPLLPYPHCHVVFTLPKRIRPFFKFRRSLLSHIYRAVWGSWRELVAEQSPDGQPAAVEALHTAGDLLGWHPHVHGLFLAGALEPGGTFRQLAVDPKRLERLCASKMLSALEREELLSPEEIDNMNSWAHSGFNVFIGEPITADDTKRLLFAARYLKRCHVSNERLRIDEDCGEPVIEYSARSRGARKTNHENRALTVTPEPDESPSSASWARCIRLSLQRVWPDCRPRLGESRDG